MNNASVNFVFDAKSLTYYMYVNVNFKKYGFQFKIPITKEDYEMLIKAEKDEE